MRFNPMLAIAVLTAVALSPPMKADQRETMFSNKFAVIDQNAGFVGTDLPAAAYDQEVQTYVASRVVGLTFDDNELRAMMASGFMEIDTSPNGHNAGNMNAIYLGAGHDKASRVNKLSRAAPAGSAGSNDCFWIENDLDNANKGAPTAAYQLKI